MGLSIEITFFTVGKQQDFYTFASLKTSVLASAIPPLNTAATAFCFLFHVFNLKRQMALVYRGTSKVFHQVNALKCRESTQEKK